MSPKWLIVVVVLIGAVLMWRHLAGYRTMSNVRRIRRNRRTSLPKPRDDERSSIFQSKKANQR